MQNETIKNSGLKQHKSSSLDLELHSPTTTSSQLGKKKELASPFTTWVVIFLFCFAQKLLQLPPTAAQ
jgi:hypothetical protein